jgi:peptide deformylase
MKLPIYIYGMPVLREVAKDVDVAQKEELQSLVTEMFETLTASNGVGLAAPQIGRSIRVVVIDLTVLSDEYPEYKDFRHVFYNAHVLEGSEETDTMEEGCLSLPGISEKVERPTKVHVQYLDDNFQPHDEWVSGYLARVMQHEFDHLEGQMFVDKISSFRRQMIKSKLSNFLKGKTRCSYKVKTLK